MYLLTFFLSFFTHTHTVKEATSILLKKRIPNAAKFLLTRLSSSEWEHPDRLCHFLHTRGINLRYLGLFRQCVRKLDNTCYDSSKIRNVSNAVMGEMVARSAKHILRERLRKLGDASISDRKRDIVAFFNALQGRELPGGKDLERDAKKLWQDEIPNILQKKYSGGLEENDIYMDLRPEDPHFFFTRVQILTGINFRSSAGHRHDLRIVSSLQDEKMNLVKSRGRKGKRSMKKKKGRKKNTFMSSRKKKGMMKKKKTFSSFVMKKKEGEKERSKADLLYLQRPLGMMKKSRDPDFLQANMHQTEAVRIQAPPSTIEAAPVFLQSNVEQMEESVPVFHQAPMEHVESSMRKQAPSMMIGGMSGKKMLIRKDQFYEQKVLACNAAAKQRTLLKSSSSSTTTTTTRQVKLKRRYGGQTKLTILDLEDITVRCKPFYSVITQSQADAYHAAASYTFDNVKKSSTVSVEKVWECEKMWKTSFEIFEETFAAQPDDPKIAVEYAVALLCSVRNPLCQKPIRRRQQAMIMILKAQDLFEYYGDTDMMSHRRDRLEQKILKELVLDAYDSLCRSNIDTKYMDITRESLNKACEILDKRQEGTWVKEDEEGIWGKAARKLREVAYKKIASHKDKDIEVMLQDVLGDQNKDLLIRVSDKGFCEINIEFGNTYVISLLVLEHSHFYFFLSLSLSLSHTHTNA